MLFMKPDRAIFTKNGGGVRFCANNGKFPGDGDDAVMIPLVTSKERNLSHLWDSSAIYLLFYRLLSSDLRYNRRGAHKL